VNHILGARQFHQSDLGELFELTDELRGQVEGSYAQRRELAQKYVGLKLATIFYEPSTRTRLSFESAAETLGIGILSTESAGEYSSAVKGESLEHTIKTVATLADAIVLRHPDDDSANRAAAVSRVPIINGGSGKSEHPTQGQLDAYTINREKGRLDGLTVVIGGDLAHGRTAQSIAEILALYPNNELRLVSTPDLAAPDSLKDYLDDKDTSYAETRDMYGAFEGADVVYWTRLQLERIKDPSVVSKFHIGQVALQAMEEYAILMHPLPIDSERGGEIHPSVDDDPRAKYFDQVENGVFVRAAILDQLMAPLVLAA
jgi:aspartate carbamoyltransferase catalytic subunit